MYCALIGDSRCVSDVTSVQLSQVEAIATPESSLSIHRVNLRETTLYVSKLCREQYREILYAINMSNALSTRMLFVTLLVRRSETSTLPAHTHPHDKQLDKKVGLGEADCHLRISLLETRCTRRMV